jgi:D-glycero-D-manno-heptose 1,7-bisphosphate phosphatase
MSSGLNDITCPIIQNYNSPNSHEYILIDRDNTIIEDAGYTYNLSDLRFIPEAITVMKRLQSADYNFVVVSNQGGIGLEKFTVEQMLLFNNLMVKELELHGVKILAIYSCPHHPLSPNQLMRQCMNRKPSSGMIQAFLSDFRTTPSRCIMIGDAQTDLDAANELDIRGFLVKDPSDWNSMKVDSL